MRIGIPRETDSQETRTPIIPQGLKSLVDLGAEVVFEGGLGVAAGFPDQAYLDAGGREAAREETLSGSDLILGLAPPRVLEVSLLKPGAVYIGFLDPVGKRESLEALARQGVSALSMEMIPRTTKAQKMDALSSQANLAGYVAVVLAANHLNRIFPMMTTPAGTIPPARVFVIGAGVAGLQAIATAKRLGARVQAFDTRPEVEEQVRSVGARFLKVDLGETGSTEQGYARALTREQMEIQQKAMEKVCHQADVVITTAQIFGRQAPLIIRNHVLAGMKAGSIIVDLAVESGGNVEASEMGKVVDQGGVKIVGLKNLPGLVAAHSSLVYSSNLVNLVSEFWSEEKKRFVLDLEDEIIQGSLITHEGSICHDRFKDS